MLVIRNLHFIGQFGLSPKTMAPSLINAIIDCMRSQSHSTLEIIDIVIFQIGMLEDYAIAMKQAGSKNGSISKLFRKNQKIENIYQISGTNTSLPLQ